MLLSTLKSTGLAVLGCGLLLLSAGVMARQAGSPKAGESADPAASKKLVATAAPAAPAAASTEEMVSAGTPDKAAGASGADLSLALGNPAQPQGAGGGDASRTHALSGFSAESAAVEETVGQDPKSKVILAKLDEPISMAFQEETPLEDVLKYVQQTTVSPDLPKGIPIYVDPIGLQEADRTMTSTVRNMNLEGVPLRRTLQLLMKQIGLGYFVVDGMLYITSEDAAKQPLGTPMQTPAPLSLRMAKAERGELTMQEMEEMVKFLKTRQQILNLNEENTEGGVSASRTVATVEAKPEQQAMDSLVKELRELVAALKAEKAPKKGGGLQ